MHLRDFGQLGGVGLLASPTGVLHDNGHPGRHVHAGAQECFDGFFAGEFGFLHHQHAVLGKQGGACGLGEFACGDVGSAQGGHFGLGACVRDDLLGGALGEELVFA